MRACIADIWVKFRTDDIVNVLPLNPGEGVVVLAVTGERDEPAYPPGPINVGFVANGTPNCDDDNCCVAVCALDPFCCEVDWDVNCAGHGFLDSGCGAAELCNCNAVCGDLDALSCCAANGFPSCDDAGCCAAVCACDSYCCDVEWDEFCAGTGNVPDCGAEIVCADLCAPSCPTGALEWISPPNGIVDARQPHDLQSTTPTRGFDTIIVSGPPGADRGCWSMCETAEAGDGNRITSIVEDAGLYTNTLERPITAGGVTTITYTDDGAFATTAEFTAHPGNANGVASADGLDVTDLADMFDGLLAPPWDLASTDIDYSGTFSPLDFLAIIDVLNGAEALAAWKDTPLPTAAPTCP